MKYKTNEDKVKVRKIVRVYQHIESTPIWMCVYKYEGRDTIIYHKSEKWQY